MGKAKEQITSKEFKTGYAAIVGIPNVGKSTLLNTILGTKLSIMSAKPQTTRKRVLGIHSSPTEQIIFLDTPGIMPRPTTLLHLDGSAHGTWSYAESVIVREETAKNRRDCTWRPTIRLVVYVGPKPETQYRR